MRIFLFTFLAVTIGLTSCLLVVTEAKNYQINTEGGGGQYVDLEEGLIRELMRERMEAEEDGDEKDSKKKHESQGETGDHVGAPAAAAEKKGQLEVPFPPPAPQAASLTQNKRALIGSGENVADTVFITVAFVCTIAGVIGIIVAATSMYRLHRRYRSAEEAEYGPQYGVTGPTKSRGGGSPSSTGDAKLANSAHLYHYQHTKQQIIAMEQAGEDTKGAESEDSEGEGDDADYSVYECPGLAPTGDIEVNNPLFDTGSPVPSPPAAGGKGQSQVDSGPASSPPSSAK